MSGGPGGSPRSVRLRVRVRVRPVRAGRLWTVRLSPVAATVRAEAAIPGSVDGRGDESVVVSVPSMWLPAHPHLPSTPGTSGRPASHASSIAPAGASTASKKALSTRGPARPRALPVAQANFTWAYGFVFDTTAEGKQIKCLTMVDELTRECLAIEDGRPQRRAAPRINSQRRGPQTHTASTPKCGVDAMCGEKARVVRRASAGTARPVGLRPRA